MDGDSKILGRASPRAVIDAINVAGCRTIGEVRTRLHALLPELGLLEIAPLRDVPVLARPTKPHNSKSPQPLLPFAVAQLNQVSTNRSLQYYTGLLGTHSSRLEIIVCLLSSGGESGREQARITPEGERLITALIDRRPDYSGGMSPIEVKCISTQVLRDHLRDQAKAMRVHDSYDTFQHWPEVETYLQRYCGYLYCLGTIFPMYSRLLGQYPEQVLCFGDPDKREKGLIIARRDLTSGQIGFTPAGKACIRYCKTHLITGSPTYDYVVGSTMRRAISNCQNRGRGLARKVEASDADHHSLQFNSLDEAEARLKQLPALHHLPLYRGKDFIGIRRKGKKIFQLVSPYRGKFVERPELSALLADLLQVSIYLDELALLAQFETGITRDGQLKNSVALGKIEKQRTRVISNLLAFLEEPEAPKPVPKQGQLDFRKSSA
ncbi:hypothetical protein KA517_01070 [Candidatus Gracilibacteria bacterium]|nr:hypothetical protein [Candidatus Gracilibacteria bacterium]